MLLSAPEMKLNVLNNKTWAWIVAILVYALVFQAFYNLMDDKTIWPYADVRQAVDYILRNTLSIFFIFGAGWLIVFKMTNRNLSTPMKILVDMCFAALALVTFNMLYSVTFKIQHIDWVGTAFNSVMTMLALETVYYVKGYLSAVEEREMLSARIREYRYMALKQQVNPHFLFNSLNILYSLVRNSSDKSLAFIESLSNIYRYVLRHQNSELVGLREEMDFAQEYLKILSLRYVDQLQVVYIMPDGLPERKVVPFTMQLLIENVVKHNVMTKSSPMVITISIKNEEMDVHNPKVLKQDRSKGGTGLHYLSQLYEMHGREFKVYDDKNDFHAIIPLIWS